MPKMYHRKFGDDVRVEPLGESEQEEEVATTTITITEGDIILSRKGSGSVGAIVITVSGDMEVRID